VASKKKTRGQSHLETVASGQKLRSFLMAPRKNVNDFLPATRAAKRALFSRLKEK
jgi:hypothetical protein